MWMVGVYPNYAPPYALEGEGASTADNAHTRISSSIGISFSIPANRQPSR